MIIKSLSRKARGAGSAQGFRARRGKLGSGSNGGKAGKTGNGGASPFAALTAYMDRGIEAEEGEAVLWHNFYGSEGTTTEEITSAFEANAKLLHERKNGNVLYHEILSFADGHTLKRDELLRMIADVGQEYLRCRAPQQLAYGVVHLETDHAHLHLMISANRVNDPSRVRLSRKEFAEAQKATERYTLSRYPELGQVPIYDRDPEERARARAERVKGQSHEQAMKARTGAPSRKDTLKMRLHHLFERAKSVEALHRLAGEEGLAFYQRGKSVGVIEQDAAGNDKKHRLATLGVDLHYKATRERLERGYDPKSPQQSSPEPDMAERKVRRLDPFERRPTFPESVIKELVTNERPEILLDPWEREPNTPAQNDIKQAPSEQDIDDAIPGVFVPPGTRVVSEAEKRIKALEASKTRARERDKEDKDRGDRDR